MIFAIIIGCVIIYILNTIWKKVINRVTGSKKRSSDHRVPWYLNEETPIIIGFTMRKLILMLTISYLILFIISVSPFGALSSKEDFDAEHDRVVKCIDYDMRELGYISMDTVEWIQDYYDRCHSEVFISNTGMSYLGPFIKVYPYKTFDDVDFSKYD